jgi:hypothetical protein
MSAGDNSAATQLNDFTRATRYASVQIIREQADYLCIIDATDITIDKTPRVGE